MVPSNCFVKLFIISHPMTSVMSFESLIPIPISSNVKRTVSLSDIVTFLIIFLFSVVLSGNAFLIAIIVSSSMIKSNGVMTSIDTFIFSSTYVLNSISIGELTNFFVLTS